MQVTATVVCVHTRRGGVTAYQTDWSVSTLILRVTGTPMGGADGNPISLPMASLEGRPGASSMPLFHSRSAARDLQRRPVAASRLQQGGRLVPQQGAAATQLGAATRVMVLTL